VITYVLQFSYSTGRQSLSEPTKTSIVAV